MKILKKLSVFFAVAAIFAVASVVTVGAASPKPKAYVNSTRVNVRAGAGTGSKVVANVGKKTPLTLLSGKKYNKVWYYVKLKKGTKGYIHKDYVTVKKNQLYINSAARGYKGYTYKYSNFVNTTGKKAKWTSSNKKAAKVSSSGKVTCLKKGTAVIRVRAGSKTCTSKITVSNATVKFPKASVTIFSDTKLTLNASCKKKVKYSSSDKSVATVSSKGVVTPRKTGKVKITAKSKSGSAVCTVTIKKRTITLTTVKTTLYKGCNAIIKATGGKSGYTYTSSDTSVLTVTDSGIITAVGEGEAKVVCKSGSLSKSMTFTVKNGTAVNISNTSGSMHKGMTLYLKSSTKGVTWSSSDASVATVDKGYVYGVKKGTAVISASTSTGEITCLVTVNAAQPVRFVYASENSVLPGNTVTFYAVTDTSRTGVKFKITDPNGKSSWLKSTSKATEDGRYIWSAGKKLTTAGSYAINAYSTKKDSSWSTGTGGEGAVFVNESASRSATSYGERRATTALINLIADYEGFLSTVTPDQLANNTPTVGYGRVVYAGSSFYNGMTQSEAYAYLVKTVNESGYTSNVNKVLSENKIKFNQNQFDALVDFSYNLGAYAITLHEELIGTLLDSYGKASYAGKGFVSSKNVVLRAEAKASSSAVSTLEPNTTVTLVSDTVYNSDWYNVRLNDDTTGFVKKSQITLRSDNTQVRNLKNVTVDTFVSNFLEYHHSGGVCYYGLLYRRADEAEMFFYRDYTRDGKTNSYGLDYTCSKNSSIKLP